ncbi:hypothetical protein ACFS07_34295 [Undibacterium arcticum]
MKLATFLNADGQQRIGSVNVEDQTILDLQSAHEQENGQSASPWLNSMLALIDGGVAALALARKKSTKNAAILGHIGFLLLP